MKKISIFLLFLFVKFSYSYVAIIPGSTRESRSSLALAECVKQNILKDSKIIDLKDYNLPFFEEKDAPAATRSRALDSVKKFSKDIDDANKIIFIIPEYNGSIPSVLKNAIDHLFHEWNNKDVFLISYSGGTTGGQKALSHFKDIASSVKMSIYKDSVLIPQVWKNFNKDNRSFNNELINKELSIKLKEFVK